MATSKSINWNFFWNCTRRELLTAVSNMNLLPYSIWFFVFHCAIKYNHLFLYKWGKINHILVKFI